ncbi:MAG: TetR/AcrR family transcriptional regulator [Myxococcota bacterium]
MAPPSSRDKILDVAEVLFARRGYAGVGLREVTEQAGLGKSSLFHHFKSKDVLYGEVLGEVLGRIRLVLDPIVASDAKPELRLVAWVEGLVDALATYPSTARLLMRALVEDDPLGPDLPEAIAAESVLSSILDGIRTLLDEGVKKGVFRDVSIPHSVQTLIGATVYHFASGEFGENLLGRPLISTEAVRRRKTELVRMLQHGLLA